MSGRHTMCGAACKTDTGPSFRNDQEFEDNDSRDSPTWALSKHRILGDGTGCTPMRLALAANKDGKGE